MTAKDSDHWIVRAGYALRDEPSLPAKRRPRLWWHKGSVETLTFERPGPKWVRGRLKRKKH